MNPSIELYVRQRHHLSNARFVVMAYEELFQRGLDEAGYSAWLTQLNAGLDRAQMVAQFLASPEFLALHADHVSRFTFHSSSPHPLTHSSPHPPPRSSLEQYQDIWRRGQLLKRGVRECSDRFALIADFCRNFNRPFTVLDLGANLGYFSLRLTECFDCTAVACEGIYGDWLHDILIQNANPRVILLKQTFTLADLRALAQVEHFDVVLGLSVIHHLDGSFEKSLEVLRSLGDHLILELPFEPNACGQEVVQQAVSTTLPEDAIFMGLGRSHLTEGRRQIIRLSRPKTRLEKSYLGTPRRGLDLAITSTFGEKHVQFHNKHESRPWHRGLNLQTYLWFHGAYPPCSHIAHLVNNLPLDARPHGDIQPWNMILQGDAVQLIDRDDPNTLDLDDTACRDRLVRLLLASPANGGSSPPHPLTPSPSLSIPLRWRGPVFNPSGYASEAMNFILPLANRVELGIFHDNNLYSENFVAGLAPAVRAKLLALHDKYSSLSGGIVIWHNPANGFGRLSDAQWNIGRTMFETDRIPHSWVAKCNALDEVWVPSKFNVETFANSGVERDKLHVIPGAVDEKIFNPESRTPWPLPNPAKYNFLSIFEWSSRKGWDVLLAAYLREFSADDDVCLYLRTYLFSQPDGDPAPAIWQRIRDYAAHLNLGDKPWPRIELLADQIPAADLPRLYKSVDCLVAPSRGEGWGRPQHEAMLMGLPVIATNWSGNTEFMTAENSYLLDFELVDIKNVEPELIHYRGHRWANPSEAHLRTLMRQVQQNPAQARQRGARARADILAQYTPEPVADRLLTRLQQIQRHLLTPTLHPLNPHLNLNPNLHVLATDHATRNSQLSTLNISWRGSFHDHGSLSHVNRELTRALAKLPHLHLTCIDSKHSNTPTLQHPTTPDVTLHHSWPPNWQSPAHGAWVLIQPWEYGALPAEWVHNLRKVDEAWVPSEYVRRVYVESGVDPAKVKIVPNGIDPERFHPQAPPMNLATAKTFKFLFVGGTIQRKGPDLLLQAYLDYFTADDDVCLVIKDFGGQSIYNGQTFAAQIKAAQKQPNAPEILYLDQDLPPEQLPGLYTACDCLVHPYRGEGFALPVLEAMACGLPVIVTAGGATDDFATDEFAERVPALKSRIGNTISGIPLVHDGWWLEPPSALIGARMHWIFHHRDQARAKAARAGEHVRREWTWDRAAQIALSRLQELAAKKRAQQEALQQRRARQMAPIQLPVAAQIGDLAPAREFLRAQKFTDAANSAATAINQRPFHPEALLLLAEIAQAQNQLTLARQYADHACRLAPKLKGPKEFLKSLPASKLSRQDHSLLITHYSSPPHPLTPSPTQRLSVCLIVKNEQRFLPQCLSSIRPLASQIVVVDTGSTDRTIDIAKEFGAEVYSFTWRDDFSAARNAALERATGDWVLVLDADEELPPASIATLKKEMRNPDVMAYRLPIVNKGKEDEGHSYVPRLFRNAPGLFFIGRVHEQVFTSVEVRRAEWGLDNRFSEATIIHHGYDSQLQRDRAKNSRNLALLELALEEMPNEPHLLMQYGMELARSGQLWPALDHYWEALHLLQPAQALPELRETLLTQLATHLLAAKDFSAMEKLFHTPLAKSAPLTASMHFVWGLAEMEMGRYAAAAEQMSQVLSKRGQKCLSPIHKDIRKGGPNHCLALCYQKLKQPAKALKALQAGLAQDPHSRPLRYDYALFLAEQGQPVDALKVLYELVKLHPQDTAAWILGAEVALNRPDLLEFACDWTSEAVKNCPECKPLALLRAETLVLVQDIAGAHEILKKAPVPVSAKYIAALTLCEVLGDGRIEVPAQAEGSVSQEFIQWYRKLLRLNAVKVVQGVNARVERIQQVLPSAAQILEQALLEAEVEQAA